MAGCQAMHTGSTTQHAIHSSDHEILSGKRNRTILEAANVVSSDPTESLRRNWRRHPRDSRGLAVELGQRQIEFGLNQISANGCPEPRGRRECRLAHHLATNHAAYAAVLVNPADRIAAVRISADLRGRPGRASLQGVYARRGRQV